MKSIFLFRHGATIIDGLLPMGEVQVELAVRRFQRVCDGKGVIAWNAVANRAKETARVFTRNTGIMSETTDLLAIATFHDKAKHQEFAALVARCDPTHAVLIGHDENRVHMEAVVAHCWGIRLPSPEVPHGGLLRFTPSGGYELI